MKIYLSGGFKTSWQEDVIRTAPQHEYFNPKVNYPWAKNEEVYTSLDLYGIRWCDYLFAYIEAGNPSGYGVCVELGYAKALNKGIILVDERSLADESFHRYMGMCRAIADINCSWQQGLNILQETK